MADLTPPAKDLPERFQLSLLVVDDEMEDCKTLADLLRLDGYNVHLAHSASETLRRLRDHDYHIVFMDLLLDGNNPQTGLDLLQGIRRMDEDIPVVVFTGHPTLASVKATIPFEIAAYLEKPCSYEELRGTIDQISRRKGYPTQGEEVLVQTIGRRIRERRRDRNLTLKQLSRRTNLSISLLSQIERADATASISSLFKIAVALGVRLSDLLGDL